MCCAPNATARSRRSMPYPRTAWPSTRSSSSSKEPEEKGRSTEAVCSGRPRAQALFAGVRLLLFGRRRLAGALDPAAAQRLVERGLLRELRLLQVQQGLLGGIERALRVE